MKQAVVYLTKTGHSRKLAHAVAEVLGVPAQAVKNSPSLPEDCQLFLVGGIYGGHSLPPMLEYAHSLSPERVRQAVLITSCTTGQTRQDDVRQALLQNGIPVADEFVCRGSFLFLGLGHPNKQELADAAALAKRQS